MSGSFGGGQDWSSDQNEHMPSGEHYDSQNFNENLSAGRETAGRETQENFKPPAQFAGKIDLSKRFVALIIDVIVGYIIGTFVSMIPLVGTFISAPAVILAYLLFRDCLFEGRGIGKNCMGLRVVDKASGGAPLPIQSLKRNGILFLPVVVLMVVEIILRFVPISWLNTAVNQLINVVGMAYVALVLPFEAYRAYSREDGLRLGDELAGTELVEADMNFSNPLPKGKFAAFSSSRSSSGKMSGRARAYNPEPSSDHTSENSVEFENAADIEQHGYSDEPSGGSDSSGKKRRYKQR